MTAPTTTTISVRGDAQRNVAPDQVQLHTTVSHLAGSKAEATAATKQATGELIEGLTGLGGTVLTVESMRTALTWSVHSMNTHEEYADKGALGHGPTGRHVCEVTLQVVVRDFGLLTDVAARLTGRDDIRVHAMNWAVDDDNPAWALVRADAIHAALRKGDDYAAALGGAVIAVVHVADAGLLGGDNAAGWVGQRAIGLSHMGAAGGSGPEELTLDPVPQVVSAVIDARFTATIGALPGR